MQRVITSYGGSGKFSANPNQSQGLYSQYIYAEKIYILICILKKIKIKSKDRTMRKKPCARYEKNTAFYYQQTDVQGDSKIKGRTLFAQLLCVN